VTRTYTYGLQRISENQVVDSVWTPSFYGYDGFGTVRQLTNTAGAVTDTFEYDAFGNAITHTGTTPNNYLYRGEQYDSDLGLYYLRARYYNPQTGRFMSRDPLGGQAWDPKTLHKYVYAGGDPVNLVDPKGQGSLQEYVFNFTLLALAVDNYGQLGLYKLGVAACFPIKLLDVYFTWVEEDEQNSPDKDSPLPTLPDPIPDLIEVANEWCEAHIVD
jgi:RHS repeat-associated protein